MNGRTPLSELARRNLPKDTPRRVLFGAYVLMLLIGLGNLGGDWLIGVLFTAAALIGMLGNNRPVAVVLAWSPLALSGIVGVANVATDRFSAEAGLILLGVVGGALVLAFMPPSKARQELLAWNQQDLARSQGADPRLEALAAAPPPTAPGPADLRVLTAVRLGEVDRHFDTGLHASIGGWLNHQLSVHGWLVSVPVGNWRLGLGRVGISGVSRADLTQEGTTRDNLMSDGFVAVFETTTGDGVIDTVRVVVPSVEACREQLRSLLEALSQHLGPGSFSHQALMRQADRLVAAVRTDVSYVSDRLTAMLRQPAEQRPPITIVGSPLTEHALLGGSIQFGQERPLQLYPIAYLRSITDALASSGKPAVDAVLIAKT